MHGSPEIKIFNNFIIPSELLITDKYLDACAWSEPVGTVNLFNNVSDSMVGDVLAKIQVRLRALLEKSFSCYLSNETLGTFNKYKVGEGLSLHNDEYIIDDSSGVKIMSKTFSGFSKRDISSTIYWSDDFTGGEMVFPGHGIKYQPQKGSVIAFPSNDGYQHEVLPVISGRRIMSSIFWHRMTHEDNSTHN